MMGPDLGWKYWPMGVPMGLGRRRGTASLGPWSVTQLSAEWSAAGWGCVLSEERWRVEVSPLFPPHHLCQAATQSQGSSMRGLLVLGEKFPCSPKNLQLLPLLTKGQNVLLSRPLVASLPPLMFPKPASRVFLSQGFLGLVLLLIRSWGDCSSEAGRSLHIRLAPVSRSWSFKA